MTTFDFERLKASMGTETRERNQRTLSTMRTHISASLMFATQISSTIAWGSLGHETVAFIAQNFVKFSTLSYCQGLLGDTSSSYLANASTWADSYKHISEGSFSRPFHYIDAHDDPPTACDVDYNRDCGESGCLVSAIQNYVCL